MLHGFGKPMHNANGNKISYQGSLHNLRRFRCYATRLITVVQRRGKFGPRSKPCMIVGYTQNSKTLWRIWDPEFQKVKSQSEVIFDEERNAHRSCLHESNEIETNMFGLSEDKEYMEEQILEMSLSEDKTVNLCSQVRDPHLTCMKLVTRKQKKHTAGVTLGDPL
jgi:hypothetical protein